MEDDPLFYFFIAIAIFERIQDEIINLTEPSEIVNILDKYRAKSKEVVRELCTAAIGFKLKTPASFRQLALVTALRVAELNEKIYTELKTNLCLHVNVGEVLQHQSEKLAEQHDPINFLIVDCRTTEQFTSGRLPSAKHLNPNLVTDPWYQRFNSNNLDFGKS